VAIYLRITVNGDSCETSTKQKGEPSKWNTVAGRVEGKTEAAKTLNACLELLQG